MAVPRASEHSAKLAPAADFTGTVFSDEIVVGKTPSRMRASAVSFAPGARTACHGHPGGKPLFAEWGHRWWPHPMDTAPRAAVPAYMPRIQAAE